ncbi:hypothetical protein C8J56DRAFT_275139 [Mycena floridula]|nr:hypothetical protein C8J56DRAFT_275139 [Mycena floridula]
MAQIYYVIDDIDDEIKYDGTQHLVLDPGIYYGGSSTFNGSFNVQFEGVSMSCVGTITGGNITVSINNETPFPSSTLQDVYSSWFKSALLSDGSHSVSITPDPNTVTALDYIYVEPGPTTNLVGKTLIVDDTDPGIQYAGNWFYTEYGSATGFMAFQSNFHQTSIAGSSFNFTYIGSNMTVYGIYEESTPGSSYDLTTTLDNDPPVTRTYTGNLTNELSWGRHIALFTADDLEPGQHTVTVELSRCDSDQILAVDYIAYTPSFSSLAEMPALTPVAPTSSGIAKKPVGAIVGGVIGGLVLLGLLGLFLFRRRKHQGKRQSRRSLPAYMDAMALEPFPGK